MEKVALVLSSLLIAGLAFAICFRLLRSQFPTEPARGIWWTYLLGNLSLVFVVLSGVFDLWTYKFVYSPVLFGLYQAFFLASIPEEMSRWFVLRWRLSRKTRPLNLQECLLLGAVVGVGFAGIENSLYALTSGWPTVWERAVTALPFHTLAGAIVGYFVGMGLNHQRHGMSLLGLAITIPLHAINNFNLKLLYANALPNLADELPTTGVQGLILTGWPQNITVLAVMIALVWFLRKR